MKLTTEQQVYATHAICNAIKSKDIQYMFENECNFFELNKCIGLSFSDLQKLSEDLEKNNLYLSCIFSGKDFLTYRLTINESGVIS